VCSSLPVSSPLHLICSPHAVYIPPPHLRDDSFYTPLISFRFLLSLPDMCVALHRINFQVVYDLPIKNYPFTIVELYTPDANRTDRGAYIKRAGVCCSLPLCTFGLENGCLSSHHDTDLYVCDHTSSDSFLYLFQTCLAAH